jgi:phage terminase large subunit-like protein
VAEAVAYAEAVVAGQVPAGRLARLACERFLRDKAAADAGDGPWGFDADLVEAALLFAGQMPNIKGPEAGQPLRLMPWQKLVFANLFGFVERGTTTRRFRQAVVYVPRGNGKTTIAAPIGLYLTFVEGEGGAEGYAAAVTRDQARILFDAAQNMARRSPEFRAAFGIGVGANAIYQEATASRFAPVSSDAKALDGLNVQVAVCDEIASHKTSEVYDVLLTAMGKRRHPLLLSISTATGNNTGIGKQLWDYASRVLDGTQEDERLFALIYAADPEDDPWEEATWIKANPSWGQAVQPDAIRAIMRQARNNPAQEAAAKTRHLNIWVGADEALFSMRAWREAADLSLALEDFEGQDCHLGLDLASRTDLAALALVFPARDPDTGKARYTAFARCYLNEAAVLEARNPSYPGWSAEDYLTITPGNETDFDQIESDILDLCRRYRMVSVGFDPWQSTQMAQRLRAEGVNMLEFRATTQNFSPAIIKLDAAMRSGRLRHDGNPVLEWCMGNVVGKPDRRGNLYPAKQRPEQKIDAAVALMMAVGRAMAEDGEPDITDFLRDPVIA